MSILQMSLSIRIIPQSLSSAKTLSSDSISAQSFPLTSKLSNLSLTAPISIPFRTAPIRMGGGPRTFPGGVSKWQWKKMQAKKAKQLLKARLSRERQIYEMRKRAELKAAVSELERPWEIVEKPPALFSVGADEQLKVLADRFQKPGGLDLWSDRDGPELFRPDNGLPSSRFFPKGVVHSVKPYGKLPATSEESESLRLKDDSGPSPISGNVAEMGLQRKNGEHKNSRGNLSSSDREGVSGNSNGKLRNKGNKKDYSSGSEKMNSSDASAGYYNRINGTRSRRGGTIGESLRSKNSHEKGNNVNSEVLDMNLQNRKNYLIGSEKMNFSDASAGYYNRIHGTSGKRGGTNGESLRSKNSHEKGNNVNSEVFDMNLQNRKNYLSGSEKMNSSDASGGYRNRINGTRVRGGGTNGESLRSKNSHGKGKNVNSEVFDMNLQNDGTYGFELDKFP